MSHVRRLRGSDPSPEILPVQKIEHCDSHPSVTSTEANSVRQGNKCAHTRDGAVRLTTDGTSAGVCTVVYLTRDVLKGVSGRWVVWEWGREVARGDERWQGAVVKPDAQCCKAG